MPEVRQPSGVEVMRLDDPEMIPFLEAFIRQEKLASFRKQAYFCLAYLAQNLHRTDILHALIAHLSEEKEQHVQRDLLQWIADAGTKAQCSLTEGKALIEAIADEKKGKMRQYALQILELYGLPNVQTNIQATPIKRTSSSKISPLPKPLPKRLPKPLPNDTAPRHSKRKAA
jgi:hypothetical protein